MRTTLVDGGGVIGALSTGSVHPTRLYASTRLRCHGRCSAPLPGGRLVCHGGRGGRGRVRRSCHLARRTQRLPAVRRIRPAPAPARHPDRHVPGRSARGAAGSAGRPLQAIPLPRLPACVRPGHVRTDGPGSGHWAGRGVRPARTKGAGDGSACRDNRTGKRRCGDSDQQPSPSPQAHFLTVPGVGNTRSRLGCPTRPAGPRASSTLREPAGLGIATGPKMRHRSSSHRAKRSIMCGHWA